MTDVVAEHDAGTDRVLVRGLIAGSVVVVKQVWKMVAGSAVLIHEDPIPATSGEDASWDGTDVVLTWVDNAETEAEFEIHRNENDPPLLDGSDLLATVGADVETYKDTSATSGSEWFYQIVAKGDGPESDGTGNLFSADLTAPTAPSNLVATPDEANGDVDLAWDDNSTNEDGFKIFRDGTEIDQVGADVTSYKDVGAPTCQELTYKVQAFNSFGSADSNTDTAQIGTKPAAPTNLSVDSEDLCAGSVTLGWTDNASNEDSYEVQRHSGLDWVTLDNSLPADTTSYEDTNPPSGTTVKYRVRCKDGDCVSDWSNEVTYTVAGTPGSPSNLTTSWSSIGCNVSLSWDAATDACDYEVFRDGASIGTTSNTSFSDSGASENTSYNYEVVARNAYGDGGSATDSITTGSCDGPS